jgi:hypothetical protein
MTILTPEAMRERYRAGRCPYCDERIPALDLKRGCRLCPKCARDPGYHLVPKTNGNGSKRVFHPGAGVIRAAMAMKTPCGICRGTGERKGFYLRGKWIEPARCRSCGGRGHVGSRVRAPSDAKSGYWLLEEVFGHGALHDEKVDLRRVLTLRGGLENFGLDIDDYF